MMPRLRVGAFTVALLSGTVAHAQGSVGIQGLGYPPGQVSVRASTTGGALGESDASSGLNPAAIFGWSSAGVYMQYSPEFRSTTANGRRTPSRVSRFPLIAVGVPLGTRVAVGVSASTFAERNFESVSRNRTQVRGDSALVTSELRARGAITDFRFIIGYSPVRWLRLGVGIHNLTGESRVDLGRSILTDSIARLADSTQRIPEVLALADTITFQGQMLSFGADMQPVRNVGLSVSGRLGGFLRQSSFQGDARRGHAPSRVGVAARYDISGTLIAARFGWEGWGRTRALVNADGGAFDTREASVGAEIPGPKLLGSNVLLRLGGRVRDLPFGVQQNQPRETGFGGGIGLPLAGGQTSIDIGYERLWRTVPNLASVSERASIISVGVRLRPRF